MANTEEFELVPNRILLNDFKVLHIYNSNDQFHLPRQILVDSSLTGDAENIFYNSVALTTQSFNSSYSSLACLINRNTIEADMYMNVNPSSLRYIINYIQTGKLELMDECLSDDFLLSKTKDLANMFGMPKLLEKLENIQSPNKIFDEFVERMRQDGHIIMEYLKHSYKQQFDVEKIMEKLEDFLLTNRKPILRILKSCNIDLVEHMVKFVIEMYYLIYENDSQFDELFNLV